MSPDMYYPKMPERVPSRGGLQSWARTRTYDEARERRTDDWSTLLFGPERKVEGQVGACFAEQEFDAGSGD